MSKIALIMRGAPGSGKSRWLSARGVTRDCIASADHYHESNGEYKFNPKNAALAHNACLSKWVGLVQFTDSTEAVVAVDNTNVHVWEAVPYIRLAEAFGWEVRVIRCVCPLEVCLRRGIHQVPAPTVLRMWEGMEPLPPRWSEEPVLTYDPSHLYR